MHAHAGGALGEGDWGFAWRDYPHPALGSSSLVGILLGPFLFAAAMFGFVLQARAVSSSFCFCRCIASNCTAAAQHAAPDSGSLTEAGTAACRSAAWCKKGS
jgi:hypothetical protein